jgi:hypothetical protein
LIDEAVQDMNLVRSNHRDGEVIAERLAIHILLAQSKPKEALERFDKMSAKTQIDAILKREILLMLLGDKSLPLFEKERVEEEYSQSLVRRTLFTEFDF